MTDRKAMLADARFYGAKSEPIDSVELIDSHPLRNGTLEILAVTHGGVTDLYQVVVDEDGEDILGTSGAVSYVQAIVEGAVGTLHGDAPVGHAARKVEGEQSNTSLVTGSVLVKAFRRLEPGLNPDVELLSEIGHCPNVAKVHGWVTREIEGEEYTLAMIQDLVLEGRDGWELALDYAARGESFAQEARLLGRATRHVHDALKLAFPTTTADLGVFLQRHAEELAARNGDVAGVVPQAHDLYAGLPEGEVQRIHGDLHLGQVLRTAEDYVLIDFEGEPARSLEHRRLADSPLRDVAGMIRSLDYAANFGEGAPEGWAEEATEAFLVGYGIERDAVLDAYILDKALYEVVYEADHRPEWVNIPLAAVARLMG